LIGIDPAGRASVGGFSEYLVHQKGATAPTFDLTPEALKHHEGIKRKRELEENQFTLPEPPKPESIIPDPTAIPRPNMDFMRMPEPKLHGVITGYTLAHFRFRNEQGKVVEEAGLELGDDVTITTVGGAQLKPVWGTFLVTDYLKTEMSE
jgi:lipoprotein-releasing system permease protein